MQRVQSQLANGEHLTVLELQIHIRGRTQGMHDDLRTQLLRELLRSREVIRVGMGIDEVPDAQSVLGCQRDIALDLAEFGIDHRRGAGFFASDQIRPAPSRSHCFKDHLMNS